MAGENTTSAHSKNTSKNKRLRIGLDLLSGLAIVMLILIAAPVSSPRSQDRISPASEAQAPEFVEINNVIYSGVDFKNIWDKLNLPDTRAITTPPYITGHKGADGRIRQLAEQRGYRLQAEATGSLVAVDGQKIHPTLAQNWSNLLSAAGKDGVDMYISSGYRSVSSQRSIFLRRFNSAGGSSHSNDSITTGNADSIIDKVLQTTSIPGYSRHHSGYTIDLADANTGQSFHSFADSPAYDWLSRDNYKNAKDFGFIPSYPPEAGKQGPEPEPWEFIWVGQENLEFDPALFGL